MLMFGKELKELVPEQKKKLKNKMDAFDKNIRIMARRAQGVRKANNISYADIAMLAGVSSDAVADFLSGKTVPHGVKVSAIIGAVEMLQKQIALNKIAEEAKNKSGNK